MEGDRFSIYIEMPENETRGLVILRPPNTGRMRYYSGPAYQTAASDPEIPEGWVRYRYTYSADVAGFSLLDEFVLRFPGELIRTGERMIPITSDGVLVPPELEWSLPDGAVYEGQTVYISLDMHRAKEIVFPGSLQVNSARDGILEEVTGLGGLSEYSFGGEKFNRIPLATFLYTPLESGALDIPSALVDFNDYPRKAESRKIEVLALPGGIVLESGAVGAFRVETSKLPPGIVDGEEVLFELAIAGEGSLGVLQLPAIEVENGTIEGRDQDADYVPTETGYAGRRIQTYRIRPDGPGQLRIVVPDFSWFNPQSQELESSGRQSLMVDVLQRSTAGEDELRFAEMELPVKKGLYEFYPLEISRTWIGPTLLACIPVLMVFVLSLRKGWSRRSVYGLLVFTALCAAGAVYCGLRYDPQSPVKSEKAAFLAEFRTGRADIDEARNLLEQRPRDTELLFALSKLEYDQANNARAVYLLRKAVSFAPLSPFYRAALLALENELQLHRQFSISRLLHSDWAFIIAFLCLLVSALYFAYNGSEPTWHAVFVVGSVLVLVMFVASLSLFVLYDRIVRHDYAVIREGGVMLKKIPDPDAANWIFLPEGTTVDGRVEASGFLQIKTAYGIVAWIPREGVYLHE